MKTESIPLINPTIIEQISTFLGVNQSSCSSSSILLLLIVVVIVSTLISDDNDDASVLSFLMALTKSHIPPIPVDIKPMTMRITPKPTVIRPAASSFSIVRI